MMSISYWINGAFGVALAVHMLLSAWMGGAWGLFVLAGIVVLFSAPWWICALRQRWDERRVAKPDGYKGWRPRA